MKAFIPLGIGLLALAAQAASPGELLAGYRAEALRHNPSYQPSAELGAHLYSNRQRVTAQMPSCVSCHTEHPDRPGRHVMTGKPIRPLAPAANPQRFTDPAKVEKWFRRNCTEVIGRECSAAEKADFLLFLMKGL